MKKYLVVGNPIGHSLSPLLHNYWIKKYKIEALYEKKEIEVINSFFGRIAPKIFPGKPMVYALRNPNTPGECSSV